MSQATLKSILDAVKVRVESLSLTDTTKGSPGGVVPVVLRKLPRRGETLDPPTQITISPPDAPDQVQYAFFGGQWWKYTVLITIICPNDKDLVSNIDIYTQWRESIRGLFLTTDNPGTNLGVPAVFDARVRPMVLFNRGMLSAGFDFQQLGVEFTATS